MGAIAANALHYVHKYPRKFLGFRIYKNRRERVLPFSTGLAAAFVESAELFVLEYYSNWRKAIPPPMQQAAKVTGARQSTFHQRAINIKEKL